MKKRTSTKVVTEYQGQSSFGMGVKREPHVHSDWTVKDGRDACGTCPYIDPRSMSVKGIDNSERRAKGLLPPHIEGVKTKVHYERKRMDIPTYPAVPGQAEVVADEQGQPVLMKLRQKLGETMAEPILKSIEDGNLSPMSFGPGELDIIDGTDTPALSKLPKRMPGSLADGAVQDGTIELIDDPNVPVGTIMGGHFSNDIETAERLLEGLKTDEAKPSSNWEMMFGYITEPINPDVWWGRRAWINEHTWKKVSQLYALVQGLNMHCGYSFHLTKKTTKPVLLGYMAEAINHYQIYNPGWLEKMNGAVTPNPE